MTTRTTASAEVDDHSTNGVGTTWLKVSQLKVDPGTQRLLRHGWAQQIADGFDPDMLGIIQVSKRRDGYYVVDGQHRVAALQLIGYGNQKIECKVVKGLDKGAEAKRFSGLNQQKAVQAFDKFRVRLNYDDDAVAIQKMIKKVGLRLDVAPTDGTIAAVDACEQVYSGALMRSKEPTPWALERTLETLTGAWGMNRDAVGALLIRGIGGVHLRYSDDLDVDHLVRCLAKFNGGPIALLSRAKIRREMTAGTIWRAVAEVAVDVYNKGRRSTALPAFVR